MNVTWIKTTWEVYGSIYKQHHEDLVVFSSFTNPYGDFQGGGGRPEIYTVWGFRNSDHPLIRSIGTKEDIEQKDFEWKYFIAATKKEKD